MEPGEVSPQRRKAEREVEMAEMDVTVDVERRKCLLSDNQPKKDEDAMPGMLNSVNKSVAEV